MAAILAFLDLMHAAVRPHDPAMRTKRGVGAAPVRVNNVGLSPIVFSRFRFRAILPVLGLPPAPMQILDVVKLDEPAAIRANENEGIGNEADAARLIQRKPAGIDERLPPVIEKRGVQALLGQDFGVRPASHRALKPALHVLAQVLEELLLHGGR
jgi:hypothetical protein